MRTSIACEGLTEQLLDGTSPSWRAIQQKRIWWIWPSWLRRQIVALKIVGSSPIIHPIKITPSVRMVLFLWNPVNNGTRRERPARRAGKKVSGGHFFSSGESPMAFGTQSVGLWSESHIFSRKIRSPAGVLFQRNKSLAGFVKFAA